MPGEDKAVEGPPKVSTAEEMVDYSPAEERKEESNIKDTTISDDLKPEVDPGLKPNNISNLINNASQSTKVRQLFSSFLLYQLNFVKRLMLHKCCIPA